VVKLHVVERVAQNLREPDETSLDVSQQDEMGGAEEYRAYANRQPHHRDVGREFIPVRVGVECAEQGRIEQQEHR